MEADDPRAAPLLEADLDPDPLAQFAAWLADAEAAGIGLPEAMTLATAAADGSPSARMVLLKGHGPDGFVFFSGYESRKGRELAENPRAALVFYWHELGRQVRVEGTVERVPQAVSEEYFRTRPLGSRLAAWASPQSDVIAGRDELDARYDELVARHPNGEVPLPPAWGGFRLAPHTIEFWQHRRNRLHDRLRYRLVEDGWVVERLAP